MNAYASCGCWDPEHFGHDDHRPIAFVDEGEIAEVYAELSDSTTTSEPDREGK